MFENAKNKAIIKFPNLKIKFKNQSLFMRILGKILFFNKNFMTGFTTTINNTIYFPNIEYIKNRSISSFITLIHEIVHIHDAKKFTFPIFAFLYLFPQSLVLCSLLFFINFKFLFFLLCLAPIPAYFRMHFEKRAYMVSLYVMHKLNKKYRYNIHLSRQKEFFVKNFMDSSYYFMWPFNNIRKEFDFALARIEMDRRPYQDDLFDTLDEIIESY